MKNIPKCSECEHCRMLGRANSIYASIGHLYGRGEFWCENPEIHRLPLEAFGNRAPGFINFGTPERVSAIKIKTSPRWCPRRKEKKCE